MEKALKKWASIYVNERLMCISTSSGLRRTAIDPNGKTVLLSTDAASANEIGASLIEALSASRVLKPEELGAFFDVKNIEQNYENWVSKLIEKFSFESRRELFRDMMLCHVEDVNGVISIRPTNHEKLEAWSEQGFDASITVVVPEKAPAHEIGAAVRLAISRCTK